MTESQIEAVNFDEFKTKYANNLRLSEECAASTDALLQTDTGLAFVEFKNGKVNNRNVKDKIRDSLLLFCDFTQKTISYTREHVDFIVVYNEEKNPLPNQYKKQTNADAPSRTEISRYFLGKGNQELILFDLERYQHLYFREGTICKSAGYTALHADQRNAARRRRVQEVCEVCDRFSRENVPESGHHIRRVPADDGSSGSGESDAEFAAAVLI